MLVCICAVAILAALTLHLRKIYSRFSGCGVRNNPPFPLLGNLGMVLIRLKHFVDVANELYLKYPQERFVGTYDFVKPVILLRDLGLIKKIAVKDFESFLDHRFFVNDEIDSFFGRNLFSLKGQDWKDMRSTLSPVFTSSKIKHMIPFIVEVGNQMTSSLMKKLEESPTKTIDIDARGLSTRCANDVIASCAFGLKVDSHSEPNNPFYKMGYKCSNLGFWRVMKFLVLSSIPFIKKKLECSLFTNDIKDFFSHLVLSTMKDRKMRHIVRLDMIHLLMEAKTGQLKHDTCSVDDADTGFTAFKKSSIGKNANNRAWSDTDLVAQAVLFFLAGFETVSTAMTFLVYELAVNPEVQERLAREIREHDALSGGKLDYNAIQTMPYMDMVVSESLRLWPPISTTDRICNKEYNLGRPNGKATQDYIIKVGEGVNIPIMAIQRDPQYFPNPMKFDPERFSDENKHKINPFTYMPFGLGPRNCFGSRFALCEVKVMVYQLLRDLEVMPSERTRIPVQLSTESFNLRMKGGHWLRLRART